MTTTTSALDNVLPLPHVQMRNGGFSKRPFPHVRKLEKGEQWDPEAKPLYCLVDGVEAPVRAGEAYAITRPGMERWPLGIVSDHFRVVPWQSTRDAITTFCAGSVRPLGVRVAGHGYHVMHAYAVEHMQAAEVAGSPLTARLVVVNSYTGGDSLRAAMVIYLGDMPIGSVVSTTAMHVADQPMHWQTRVDSMIEKAIVVQDALLDLVRAANERELNDEDRAFFRRRGMAIKDTAKTALEAVRQWHQGPSQKSQSWGVWERRLDDTALVALVILLGRDVHGAALDDALGLTRRNPAGEIIGGQYRVAR